jgi:hypothetical protein
MDIDKIILTSAEKQSKCSRVKHAEGLILQLPKDHEGRNSWLLNYGTGHEAKSIRKRVSEKRNCKMQWDLTTSSLTPAR